MATQDSYDLGTEGLTEGDTIDPYLEEYWETNTEVHIPEGTYRCRGNHLGGIINDAALIGDGAGVTFDIPDGGDIHNTLSASDGSTVVSNLTVRGTAGDGKNRIRIETTDPEATLTMDRFALPDGGYGFGEHPSPIGYYLPTDNVVLSTLLAASSRGSPTTGSTRRTARARPPSNVVT